MREKLLIVIFVLTIVFISFTLGCERVFTNEARGPSSNNPPGSYDDDAADDDTDDDVDDDTDDISEVSAALIYHNELAGIPSAFESWGGDYYVNIEAYSTIHADEADLSVFDVIIIAEDVDLELNYPLFSNIRKAGKPVVAMFKGNTYLNMEGTHWYRYDAPDTCLLFDYIRYIYIWNANDITFKKPWLVGVSDGTVLQLTLTQKTANACHDFYMPDYVVALGGIPPSEIPGYEHYIAIGYEITTKIVFWGYSGKPTELTEEGQKLLANLVHYAASKMQ